MAGAYVAKGAIFGERGPCIVKRVCMTKGACMKKGVCGRAHACQGDVHVGEMVTEAGGTHPTGMHSC